MEEEEEEEKEEGPPVIIIKQRGKEKRHSNTDQTAVNDDDDDDELRERITWKWSLKLPKQQDFKLRWIEMEKEEISRLMKQNNNNADNNFHFKSYPKRLLE